MTLENLFSSVMTLMFGTDSEKDEYRDYFIPTANFIFAETFNTNNALRISDGRNPLKNIPEYTVDDWETELSYEPILLRSVVNLGIAGYIYTDDDRTIGADYKNKYEYVKTQCLNANYTEITDVYDETAAKPQELKDDKWNILENEGE